MRGKGRSAAMTFGESRGSATPRDCDGLDPGSSPPPSGSSLLVSSSSSSSPDSILHFDMDDYLLVVTRNCSFSRNLYVLYSLIMTLHDYSRPPFKVATTSYLNFPSTLPTATALFPHFSS